jgi:NAD(P)-dependent dehydrogenase (short-subunit alcohol dehydrogenase family)
MSQAGTAHYMFTNSRPFCDRNVALCAQVNLGSINSYVTYPPAVKLSDGFNPYPHGKGAVLQLSKDLGVQLAAENIRVNAVCPGFIKTGLTAGLQANDFLNDTLSKSMPGSQH